MGLFDIFKKKKSDELTTDKFLKEFLVGKSVYGPASFHIEYRYYEDDEKTIIRNLQKTFDVYCVITERTDFEVRCRYAVMYDKFMNKAICFLVDDDSSCYSVNFDVVTRTILDSLQKVIDTISVMYATNSPYPRYVKIIPEGENFNNQDPLDNWQETCAKSNQIRESQCHDIHLSYTLTPQVLREQYDYQIIRSQKEDITLLRKV